MTDTRLPDSWLLKPDLDRLSDGAWRVLTRALIFCNQQGTDGEIDALYMRYVYPFGPSDTFLAELEEIDWLVKTDRGYLIPDWEGKGQSTAAQVAAWRENARIRQRRSREKKQTAQSQAASREVTRDVGQERIGQVRKGQANYGKVSWPEVRKPGEGSENL